MLALAAVLVAVLVTLDYATIAGLYQALGAGVDGGIALTIAELALLPNIVIWAASWLLGPGFAIGTGSLVSTGGTLLGPVPGIPLLGALPTDAPALGALWLAVPVLLGFVGAWVVSSGGDADRDVPRDLRLVGAARRRRRGGRRPPRSCWASSPGGRAVPPDRGASPMSDPRRSPSRASPRPPWASARSSAATRRASADGEATTSARASPRTPRWPAPSSADGPCPPPSRGASLRVTR